jgi:hypothetical protein
LTAIAGFVDNGKVWIGGDSAGVAGWSMDIRSDSKVFRNGDFLLGFTSSFRMGQLLRYSFRPPDRDPKRDVFEYLVTDFVASLRSCLKEGGFATKDKEAEAGGTFLLGYYGRLFQVEDDYQIAEPAAGYGAVGCGHEVAKGALFATKAMKPEERMKIVLGAAELHSAGVRGPFVIDHI